MADAPREVSWPNALCAAVTTVAAAPALSIRRLDGFMTGMLLIRAV
jgi:hypothetical protein